MRTEGILFCFDNTFLWALFGEPEKGNGEKGNQNCIGKMETFRNVVGHLVVVVDSQLHFALTAVQMIRPSRDGRATSPAQRKKRKKRTVHTRREGKENISTYTSLIERSHLTRLRRQHRMLTTIQRDIITTSHRRL